MVRLLLLLLALVSVTWAVPSPGRPSLATTLTPEEYTRAGLAKLTPAELAALDAALVAHGLLPTARPAANAAATDAEGSSNATPQRQQPATVSDFGREQITKAAPAETAKELRTHIDGTVQEINGRAVFALENGQVWQQRIPDTFYFAHKLVNPEVVIIRGLGGYKMVIVPANCVLFVKRIQ